MSLETQGVEAVLPAFYTVIASSRRLRFDCESAQGGNPLLLYYEV